MYKSGFWSDFSLSFLTAIYWLFGDGHDYDLNWCEDKGWAWGDCSCWSRCGQIETESCRTPPSTKSAKAASLWFPLWCMWPLSTCPKSWHSTVSIPSHYHLLLLQLSMVWEWYTWHFSKIISLDLLSTGESGNFFLGPLWLKLFIFIRVTCLLPHPNDNSQFKMHIFICVHTASAAGNQSA